MEKNQEFTVSITDITDEGLGVGKTSGAFSGGFTWFVKDAVIGDTVLAAAVKVKKNYGFARLVKVITPSPMRVEAACAISSKCGGCQLAALSYDAQLKFKEEKVLSCLTRIGGFSRESFTFENIEGMEYPFRYRNKAQFPVSLSKDGRIVFGFYAGHTHSVIECGDCLIGSEKNREILSVCREFMERHGILPYDEKTGKGVLRHVLIRESFANGGVMVCFVINSDKLRKSEELVSMLTARCPYVSTVSLCINEKDTNVIMGDRVITLYGTGFITDKIGEISFKISPKSFFQVNPVQVKKLYGKALSYAGLTGNETVWDLYCGVGTISLFMAGHAKKVFGVEIVPEAVENAKENAVLNGIENAYFEAGSAEEVTPRWLSRYDKPDVVCVDPPRKGLDSVCIDTILKASPSRIVYVSCDPATLARDLKLLCEGGYTLEKAVPCDMFPQTVHVETVALLSR